MLTTIITGVVCGAVGWFIGAMMMAEHMRRKYVPDAKGWMPPTKPAEDPAARIVSIVRQAIASGQMDAELVHAEAERMRKLRKMGLRDELGNSTLLDKKA